MRYVLLHAKAARADGDFVYFTPLWPAVWCAGAAWADQLANWRLYRNAIATAVVLLGVTAQFVLLGLLPLLDSFAVAPAFLAGLAGGCMFMRRQRRCTRGRCCWALWQARVPGQLIPCHHSPLLQLKGASWRGGHGASGLG